LGSALYWALPDFPLSASTYPDDKGFHHKVVPSLLVGALLHKSVTKAVLSLLASSFVRTPNWLEIADFDDYTKPASVEVQVTRDTGQGTWVKLVTENVGEVKLLLNEAPEALQRLPFTVEWNGCKAFVAQKSNSDSLSLRLQDPLIGVLVSENESSRFWQWQRDGVATHVTLEKSPTKPLKTPQRCGPATDVFTSPFVVAYDATSEGAKLAAKQLQHWWQNYALGVCKLVPFHSEDELRNLMASTDEHLIVFRKVSTGTRYGEIAFGRDGVFLGKQRFNGKDISVRVLLLNPFRPQVYLLVNAGVTDEALRLSARIPMDIGQPYDYLVADERFLRDGLKGILSIGRWSREWGKR
jgi:hypothetical protein